MSKIWKHGKVIKRKRGGLRVKTNCAKCSKETTLFECESIDELKIYGFVKIFDFSRIVMQCDNCGAILKANENPDVKDAFQMRRKKEEEKAKEEEARAQRKLETEREKEQKKLMAEMEKKKAIEAKEIDKELEELKRKSNSEG